MKPENNRLFASDFRSSEENQRIYDMESTTPSWGKKMEELNRFPNVFSDEQWWKKIESNRPGKTVAIVGAIHGNEKVGIDVFRQIQDLTIDAGTVYLIGGNPKAYKENIRFIEENLNRVFTPEIFNTLSSYERKRAKLIYEITSKCDAVLDLHQSNSNETFCVCEPDSNVLAEKFKEKYIINSADEGCVDKEMDKLGIKTVCLEIGKIGEDNQSENLKKAMAQTKFFLSEMGILDKKYPSGGTEKSVILSTEYVYKTKEKFVLEDGVQAFDALEVGQKIGTDGKTEIYFQPEWKDGKILFPISRDTPEMEAFSIGLIKNP